MRKQELIHLHMLASEIRVFLSEKEAVPAGTFKEYDQNGISPTSIHYDKTAHKESLQLLLFGILRSIDCPPARDVTS